MNLDKRKASECVPSYTECVCVLKICIWVDSMVYVLQSNTDVQ